jgi:hypothetical protein
MRGLALDEQDHGTAVVEDVRASVSQDVGDAYICSKTPRMVYPRCESP